MIARTLILFSATASLTACSSLGGGGQRPAFNGIGNPKAPTVAQETRVLDLATTGAGLAAGEADRAADWLAGMGFGYGDRVAVDDSAGGGAARADLARVVGRYGLVLSDVVPVTQGQAAAGTVRLVVLRATARVDGCPDWRSTPFLPSRDQPNFGCATAGNLAAMVADANDLLTGKSAPDTGSAAAVGVKAITEYQSAGGTSSGGTTVQRESAGGGGN